MLRFRQTGNLCSLGVSGCCLRIKIGLPSRVSRTWVNIPGNATKSRQIRKRRGKRANGVAANGRTSRQNRADTQVCPYARGYGDRPFGQPYWGRCGWLERAGGTVLIQSPTVACTHGTLVAGNLMIGRHTHVTHVGADLRVCPISPRCLPCLR